MRRILAAAVLVLAVPAAAMFWPSKGSKLMLPVTDPCAASSEAGDLPVSTVTCETDEGFYLDVDIPPQGHCLGECDDGSNDGTECSADATCTGGGHCEPIYTFSIWAVSSVTTGAATVDLWLQASPTGSDYSTNEGIAAGAGFGGSGAIAGASGEMFVIGVADVRAYNDGTSADCGVTDCSAVPAKVLVRSTGANPFEALEVQFTCEAP